MERKMNEICKGCTSYYSDEIDSTNEECTLEPIFNGEKCPCLTCIVKPLCMEGFDGCQKYREFCLKQVTKFIDAPCKDCSIYDKCLDIAHDEAMNLGIDYEDPYVIEMRDSYIDENIDELFYNTLLALQKKCPKLEEYFPFQIMSRDFLIGRLEFRNQHITDDDFEDRQLELYDLFDSRDILNWLIPKDEDE